jgi:hypothetical protein
VIRTQSLASSLDKMKKEMLKVDRNFRVSTKDQDQRGDGVKAKAKAKVTAEDAQEHFEVLIELLWCSASLI